MAELAAPENQPESKLSLIDTMDRVGVETLVALLQHDTQKETAAALGISPQALWLRVNKYHLKEIMAEIPQQALMRLHMGSIKAADNLVKKIDSQKETVSLQASTEILDRVGLVGQPDVVVNNAAQFNMPGSFEKYDQVPSDPGRSGGGPDEVPGG